MLPGTPGSAAFKTTQVQWWFFNRKVMEQINPFPLVEPRWKSNPCIISPHLRRLPNSLKKAPPVFVKTRIAFLSTLQSILWPSKVWEDCVWSPQASENYWFSPQVHCWSAGWHPSRYGSWNNIPLAMSLVFTTCSYKILWKLLHKLSSSIECCSSFLACYSCSKWEAAPSWTQNTLFFQWQSWVVQGRKKPMYISLNSSNSMHVYLEGV